MLKVITKLFYFTHIKFFENELLQKEDVETAGSGETSRTNEPGVEVSVIHTISKTLLFFTCVYNRFLIANEDSNFMILITNTLDTVCHIQQRKVFFVVLSSNIG